MTNAGTFEAKNRPFKRVEPAARGEERFGRAFVGFVLRLGLKSLLLFTLDALLRLAPHFLKLGALFGSEELAHFPIQPLTEAKRLRQVLLLLPFIFLPLVLEILAKAGKDGAHSFPLIVGQRESLGKLPHQLN